MSDQASITVDLSGLLDAVRHAVSDLVLQAAAELAPDRADAAAALSDVAAVLRDGPVGGRCAAWAPWSHGPQGDRCVRATGHAGSHRSAGRVWSVLGAAADMAPSTDDSQDPEEWGGRQWPRER